jgi:parvulin-like peptidyl-prolyl isomerase
MVHMQHQADDITDADVEKYFQEHPERFVRISLQQIAVPKQKDHGDATPAKVDPAEQQEMHRLALTIQKEAAAGWNVEKLQAKAYKAANDDSVPDVDLGHPIPEEIPVEYRKLVFDLKPGQVSAVTEDDHEYLIFKCVEKKTIPPHERKKLYGWLRMRDARQALQDMVQVQFNQQYFLAPAKGDQSAAPAGKAQ